MDQIREAELRKINAEINKLNEEINILQIQKNEPNKKRIQTIDFWIKVGSSIVFLSIFIPLVIYPTFELKTIKQSLENIKTERANFLLSDTLTQIKRKFDIESQKLNMKIKENDSLEQLFLNYLIRFQKAESEITDLSNSKLSYEEKFLILKQKLLESTENSNQQINLLQTSILPKDKYANYFDVKVDSSYNLYFIYTDGFARAFYAFNYDIYDITNENKDVFPYVGNVTIGNGKDSCVYLKKGKYRFYINDKRNDVLYDDCEPKIDKAHRRYIYVSTLNKGRRIK